MIDDPNGISGTDNVAVLFPDKPSAAPIPPQESVVKALEECLLDAASGKHTGIIILAFNDLNAHKAVITGQIPFSSGVTALDQMKFGIMVRNYADTVAAQVNKPK